MRRLRSIVVTSDWHLDASTAGFDRFDDVADGSARVLQAALAGSAGLFAFLGDLCDPDANRAPRCVSRAISVARNLSACGIPSRWLVGNHDVIEDGSGSSTLAPLAAAAADGDEGWRVIDRPTWEEFAGVLFVWLPYVPRRAAYDPSAFVESVPEPKRGTPVVVAGHLSLRDRHPGSETSEMGRGREVYFPEEAARKRWPDALLMNGHYHDMSASDSGAGVAVPGSVARLTFGEEKNLPGFLRVELREPKERKLASGGRSPAWRVTGHHLPTRALLTLDPAEDYDERTWGLLSDALVRVRPSSGVSRELAEKLAEVCAARGAAAVKVLPTLTGPAVVVPEGSGAAPAARLRAREVVEAMVADSVGADREALGALVGEVLDAEGI